jgi:photosynthetic reaction center cytochrome c subunit
MAAITEWVAPEQGCAYCHNEENLADDSLYTKVVARRMIQMTRHVNGDWASHVGATGVTCYTCHRGNAVPEYVWFSEPAPRGRGLVGNRTGQNMAAASVGNAALPSDPFTPLLTNGGNIRVIASEALPDGQGASIKQTEKTYGLMMHFSNALGANCTFCHNSRSFFDWDQSTPQRQTAWYGIRMLRDLNTDYLDPLEPHYPHVRLGPGGDAPKANCMTCHQGVNKPLLGANMVQDYPSLAGPTE